MANFFQPTQLNRPMSRQAFRPGQWNGVRVGGGTTYIQNNFYGTQRNHRGWDDNAWANYDRCECNNNSKPGVLGWIGAGIGALGAIMGGLGEIFGGKKNKVSEKGGEEPEVANEPKTQKAPEVKDAPEVAEEEEIPEDEPLIKDDMDATAMDEVDANTGKSPTANIQGKIKVLDKGDKKVPQKFSVTENGHTYTFELTTTTRTDGKPIYKCTSMSSNGGSQQTKFTKGNEYALDTSNGIKLIQYKDMAGWGKNVGKE